MSDTDAWGLIFGTDHWNHGGWSIDSRDEALVCACGTVLREPERATA